MANTVRTRFHRPLHQGGANAAGNARQGKVEVRGEISVVTYDVAGESLTPMDMGLSTLDWLDIKHENAAAGKEGSEQRDVRYNFTTSDFYVLEMAAGADVPADTGNCTLYFNAFGDTARDADLL